MEYSLAKVKKIKSRNSQIHAFAGHANISIGLTYFSMPSHWRAPFLDAPVFATMGFEGQMMIFPEAAWHSFYQNLLKLGMAASGFKRIAFGHSGATKIEPDGSLMIPQDLIKACGIKRKAILVGVGKNLEMWSPERYAAVTARQPDMSALSDFHF